MDYETYPAPLYKCIVGWIDVAIAQKIQRKNSYSQNAGVFFRPDEAHERSRDPPHTRLDDAGKK